MTDAQSKAAAKDDVIMSYMFMTFYRMSIITRDIYITSVVVAIEEWCLQRHNLPAHYWHRDEDP